MSDTAPRDAAEFQRLMLDQVPSMLSYWDVELRCRFANRAYEQWLGANPDTLVGSALVDVIGPEMFALNEPFFRAAFGGAHQTFERAVPGPDSVLRHALITYIPDVRHGRVAGVLVQVADVTPLKTAQAALQRNEEYLRELFSLSSEGIVVAGPDGRYTDVNRACCNMLGWAREELLGKTFEDLLCACEIARVAEVRALLQAGERHGEQWMLQCRDGSAIPVEVRAKFLSDGRRVGFLRDISEHRRALEAERGIAEAMERQVHLRTAELMLASQELRSSQSELQATLSQLATSHADLQRLIAAQDAVQEKERRRIARELHDDLQQKLAAIRIALGVVGSRLGADREALGAMVAEADGLASAAIDSTRRIVNDLRPQMLEDLGLVPALQALVGQFSQRTGIDGRVAASERASDEALVSPEIATCLFRVAQEALNNVAKHAQASKVRLRLTRLTGGRLKLRIGDNGCGLDSSDRRKAQSFGLQGMFERLRAVGGVLHVDGRPGKGTTVEATVPVRRHLR